MIDAADLWRALQARPSKVQSAGLPCRAPAAARSRRVGRNFDRGCLSLMSCTDIIARRPLTLVIQENARSVVAEGQSQRHQTDVFRQRPIPPLPPGLGSQLPSDPLPARPSPCQICQNPSGRDSRNIRREGLPSGWRGWLLHVVPGQSLPAARPDLSLFDDATSRSRFCTKHQFFAAGRRAHAASSPPQRNRRRIVVTSAPTATAFASSLCLAVSSPRACWRCSPETRRSAVTVKQPVGEPRQHRSFFRASARERPRPSPAAAAGRRRTHAACSTCTAG